MINITLVQDFDSFFSLKQEWTALIEESEYVGATLTWEWVQVWLKYFQKEGELWILLAREDQTQKLIGIAPLFKTKEKNKLNLHYRQLGFIAATHNHEYLNFIVQRGQENLVIPKFIEFLLTKRNAWDTLQFSNIWGNTTIGALLNTSLDWTENNRRDIVSPYLTLPQDYESWQMHTISKNHRKKLRKYERDLNNAFPGQWDIQRVTTPDKLAEIFPILVKYHQTQWEALGQPGAFHYGEWADYYLELMQALLKANRLRLFYLNINGEPVAVLFAYDFGTYVCDYIGGMDHSSTDIPIGHVLTHHSIRMAIEEDFSEYDFMWGEQEYKFSFGAERRTLHTYEYIKTPLVRLEKQLIRYLRMVKRRIKHQPNAES